MKIWVTKYALTVGIKVYKAREEPRDGHVVVHDRQGLNGWSMFFGKDWHTSEDAALKRAEQMREDKIASLKKQIEKLNELSFKSAQDKP